MPPAAQPPSPTMTRALELRLRERIDQLRAQRDSARHGRAIYRSRLYAMRRSRDLWKTRALRR